MKVAAVQFKPVFKDLHANIETMVDLIQQAANRGAELIVLPELATTGYSFSSHAEVVGYAESFFENSGPAASLNRFRDLSKALNVAIAWGLPENSSGTLYNAQCLVTPEGGVATYRKRNLWGSDYWWATPGDVSPTIVTWRGRTIGLLVCRDIRDENDVSSEIYEPGDADIVAFSSNFGNGAFPAVSWVDFARENKTTLVVSNRYGDEYGEETYNNFGKGGICVIRPDGRCLRDGFRLSESCLVLADV